jgi:hypothetical protein
VICGAEGVNVNFRCHAVYHVVNLGDVVDGAEMLYLGAEMLYLGAAVYDAELRVYFLNLSKRRTCENLL